MYFDTHAHYDDSKFDEDRDGLLENLHSSGVDFIIDPGCDLKSTETAAKLAETYKFVYFAAGIHPEELNEIPDNYIEILAEYAKKPKCAAIGEIGLDYYWDDSRKEEQKKLFSEQLRLAEVLGKPVIIHDRDAHGDCLDIIRENPGNYGVFHCYSGSAEMASELLKRGWYLGFDGPVTYKNARKTIEVLEITPLDRILIETDSPYLSPVPVRGKRNDSSNLRYIAEKIAEIKKETPEAIAEITSQNAGTLFNIR